MIFTIDSDNNITAVGTDAAIPENAQQFSSEKELGKLASDWPAERLVDIWNSLPGVKPVKKFTNRNTAAGRIWKAIQSLGADSGEHAPTRRRTKAKPGKKASPKPKAATARDGYDTADKYRSWAVQQPWTQRSRNKKVPGWLHDMALATWNCALGCAGAGLPDSSYSKFDNSMQQSQHYFNVPLRGHLNGWEQFGAYVYGDYFPPQEGWTGFDAMVTNLRPGKVVAGT